LGLFISAGPDSTPMASDGVVWLNGVPTQGAKIEFKFGDGTNVKIQEGNKISTITDSNGIYSATLISDLVKPIAEGTIIYLYVNGVNTGNSFSFEGLGTTPVFLVGNVKTGSVTYNIKDNHGNVISLDWALCNQKNLRISKCLQGSSDYWCTNSIASGIPYNGKFLVGTYTLTIKNTGLGASASGGCRTMMGNLIEYPSTEKIYQDYQTTFEIKDGQTTNINIVMPLTPFGEINPDGTTTTVCAIPLVDGKCGHISCSTCSTSNSYPNTNSNTNTNTNTNTNVPSFDLNQTIFPIGTFNVTLLMVIITGGIILILILRKKK
jgi:hypothetical protein